jgi:hypothetical protein
LYQNNIYKRQPQRAVFYVLNLDYKCSLGCLSEENELPLKCIDSYRNFDVFLSFPKLSFPGPMNIIENPHHYLLWVIKDQSSLVLLFLMVAVD